MIFGDLKDAERWLGVHPGFAAAMEYLRQTDLAQLADGRHEIDGERVYAVVHRVSGTSRTVAKLESHRRYIDVHYSVTGTDQVGWKGLSSCNKVDQPYDAEIDAEYFADTPDFWLPMPPETLAIFFPEDVHAPQSGEPPLLKVVVKVAV